VIGDLWRVFRPQLIPVFAVLLIGSFSLDWWWTVLACAVVGSLSFLLVRAEARGEAALQDANWIALIAFGGVLVVSTIVFTYANSKTAAGHKPAFADVYDVWSRALVWAGFLLWFLALLLRLGAFARTALRWALVFVLGAFFARYFAGLFIGGRTNGIGTADHIIFGALIAATLVLAWRGERAGTPAVGPGSRWASRHGLTAAVIASVAFATASIAGMASDPPSGRVKMPFKENRVADYPVFANADVSDMVGDDKRLTHQFSPVLEFTDDERWEPIDVRGYLKNADLQTSAGTPVQGAPLSLTDLRADCPDGQRSACYRLTISCSLDQSDKTDCDHGTTEPSGFFNRGTAYVRVIRRDRLAVDEQRRGYPVPQFRDDLEAVVQYWLFYYYDDWRSRTLFGWVRQGHEADWEAVTIGFSKERPLFVALSAHCGGTWMHWRDVRVAGLNLEPLHPIVGVAEGSHANYREPRANTPPDNWVACAGLKSHTASVASFAYHIRERVGVNAAIELQHLIPVTDDHPVMSFKGYWGMNGSNDFETEFGKLYSLSSDRTGPKSPPLQPLWNDPIATIFCNREKKWRYVGSQPKAVKRCNAPPKK
jgi:hypothetical protein